MVWFLIPLVVAAVAAIAENEARQARERDAARAREAEQERRQAAQWEREQRREQAKAQERQKAERKQTAQAEILRDTHTEIAGLFQRHKQSIAAKMPAAGGSNFTFIDLLNLATKAPPDTLQGMIATVKPLIADVRPGMVFNSHSADMKKLQDEIYKLQQLEIQLIEGELHD